MNNSVEHEEWRPVPGYENTHAVSSHGRIRSLERMCPGRSPYLVRERIMKQDTSSGYASIQLRRNGPKIRVHRLVALAFIPNPDNKPFVNHRDGAKLNNAKENLEWVTNGENIRHSYRHGMHKRKPGSKSTLAKPVNHVNAFGVVLATYPSTREAALALGITMDKAEYLLRRAPGTGSGPFLRRATMYGRVTNANRSQFTIIP